MCSREELKESDVNHGRLGLHSSWNDDPEVGVSAELELTEHTIRDKQVTGSLQPGDLVAVRYSGTSSGRGYKVSDVRHFENVVTKSGLKIKRRAVVAPSSVLVRKLPRVAWFDPSVEVRSSFRLDSANHAEIRLLKLAFGPQFDFAGLEKMTPLRRSQLLGIGQERLNQKLESFFPKSLPFEFRLLDIGAEPRGIGVGMVDGFKEHSDLDLRGAGIRRLISLMAFLLQQVDPAQNTIILLDEPETSLHADAQHHLRSTLERLADQAKFQVVYATHSPSMVNPARPDSVRVFTRRRGEGGVGTTVSKLSEAENFQAVRTSLGLTPSDTLLYGQVTIVVEGTTEAVCLGPLLRRLDEAGAEGFEGAVRLLECCHIICGWGDSIRYYCKLARDQNARPIAFLDGDKRKEAEDLVTLGVPTVCLPSSMEFEDIVPPEDYIAAAEQLARERGSTEIEINLESFRLWENASNLPERMLFSKRVARWLNERLEFSLSKADLMCRAISIAPPEQVKSESLVALITEIKAQLGVDC